MWKMALALSACLTMTLTTGCSTTPGVYRAQSPAGPQMQGMFGNGPVGPPTNCCPPTRKQGLIHMLGIGPGGIGGGWYPTHRHSYDYKPPEDLVYPPQNQPAAVVQYPYYTLKGPDDFFLKESW